MGGLRSLPHTSWCSVLHPISLCSAFCSQTQCLKEADTGLPSSKEPPPLVPVPGRSQGKVMRASQPVIECSPLGLYSLPFQFAAFPPALLPWEISRNGAPRPQQCWKLPEEGGQAEGSVGRGCLAQCRRSRYPVAAQGLRLIFPH